MPERLSGKSIDTNKFKRPIKARVRQSLKEVRGTRSFIKEGEGLKEKSPAEIREELMSRFQDNIAVLGPKLAENRAPEASPRQRPLITAIVSLWEENDSMLTAKMFKESLRELRRQTSASGMDLDMVIFANNGGGKTESTGLKMIGTLRDHLKLDFGKDAYQESVTKPPDQLSDTTQSWKSNIPLSGNRNEGEDRCFFVTQPLSKYNAGQLRALRDMSHAVSDEIMQGYAPDALFRMDAETILKYQPTHHRLEKEPIRAMYDALKRRERVKAISTKNSFEKFDPETGKSVKGVLPFVYEGLMTIDRGTRENFISMYGPSILAEPDYYASGMNAITDVMCGNISDDYPLTQLLRAYAKTQSADEAIKVNSLNVITHTNRHPEGKKNAENQLRRWRRQGNATDQIFPELKPPLRPLREYLSIGVRGRLKSLRGIEDGGRLSQLRTDVSSIPGLLKIVFDKTAEDPVNGEPTWEHFKLSANDRRRKLFAG